MIINLLLATISVAINGGFLCLTVGSACLGIFSGILIGDLVTFNF